MTFIVTNLFATLVILAFVSKDKFLPGGELPLTYEQMAKNRWNDFTSSHQPMEQHQEVKKSEEQLEQELKDAGLVNIKDIAPSIAVDLKYSSTDNFLLADVYGNLNDCYLQKDVAEKLAKAQRILQDKYPFYRLVVFDGVRPLSVQKTMWNALKIPAEEKSKFISSPLEKSLHNFGAAVDISIVNSDGWEMDMGTPYDYFGELGYPGLEQKMVEEEIGRAHV